MSAEYKDVTVKGQAYRIGRFSARRGAFVLTKTSGLLAPMFEPLAKSLLSGSMKADSWQDFDISKLDFGALLGPLADIPEQDFDDLHNKCLDICKADFGGNWRPVLNDNGTYSVASLEHDAMGILALIAHTLMFNFADFFSEGLLAGFQTVTSTMRQPNS